MKVLFFNIMYFGTIFFIINAVHQANFHIDAHRGVSFPAQRYLTITIKFIDYAIIIALLQAFFLCTLAIIYIRLSFLFFLTVAAY